MFLCQRLSRKLEGESDVSRAEVPVFPLAQTSGVCKVASAALTLSFLSGSTALQVRSSSSCRSRTGRTQLDRSIWTERRRAGDRKTEQKPSDLLLLGLSPSRRRVGICRPVDRVGLYGGAVRAAWPQTCQLHLPPGAASMSLHLQPRAADVQPPRAVCTPMRREMKPLAPLRG